MEIYSGKAVIIACGDSSIDMTDDGEIRITAKSIKLTTDRIDLN